MQKKERSLQIIGNMSTSLRKQTSEFRTWQQFIGIMKFFLKDLDSFLKINNTFIWSRIHLLQLVLQALVSYQWKSTYNSQKKKKRNEKYVQATWMWKQPGGEDVSLYLLQHPSALCEAPPLLDSALHSLPLNLLLLPVSTATCVKHFSTTKWGILCLFLKSKTCICCDFSFFLRLRN